MRYRFVWKGADILALIEEAKTAKERNMSYAERLERAGIKEGSVSLADEVLLLQNVPTAAPDVTPKLVFVHDDGVYMMSNAAKGGRRNGALVFYAEGYNPEIDSDHAWVLGDDFAEYIEIDWIEKNNLRPDDRFLIMLDPYADTYEMMIQRNPRTSYAPLL